MRHQAPALGRHHPSGKIRHFDLVSERWHSLLCLADILVVCATLSLQTSSIERGKEGKGEGWREGEKEGGRGEGVREG